MTETNDGHNGFAGSHGARKADEPREQAHPAEEGTGPRSAEPADDAFIITESSGTDDARFVARLALEADMRVLSDRGETFIARRTGEVPADSSGEVPADSPHRESERLGFIRVVEADGHAYINPIVTSEHARGLGVGEALVRFAQSRFGALRLVARGSAVPFYEKLGGRPMPWPAIAPLIAEDCDGCPLREDCRPTPMEIPAHPVPAATPKRGLSTGA